MATTQVRRLTPVIIVEAIEPVLPFWARIGAVVDVSVPHGAALGFVSLSLGSAELMYQSVASVLEDTGADGRRDAYAPLPQQAYLFIEVDDLAAVESCLAGEPVFLPRRTTFYGSRETGYRDPAGNLVVFADFPAQS